MLTREKPIPRPPAQAKACDYKSADDGAHKRPWHVGGAGYGFAIVRDLVSTRRGRAAPSDSGPWTRRLGLTWEKNEARSRGPQLATTGASALRHEPAVAAQVKASA